ncbi:MAG TPA: ABC transporter permease [Candidatus Acidoferrales bacterium]|nr:ABC transporter permease [Candidatus Acidoferrales bacterium]
MPDFTKIVRERIAPLRLQAAAERDLTEELAQHLEDRYRQLLGSGAAEEDAYRTAASELEDMYPLQAGLPKSRRMTRHDAVPLGDISKANLLGDLWRDLRYTCRTVRKSPLFALFVVVTLALGVGANTTVFTVINTLILNPLPVHDPSGLAAVASADAKATAKSRVSMPLSYANLKDYAARNAVFDSLAGYTSPRVVTYDSSGAPQRMFGELVTGNYFSTLGLQPAAGRFFSPEEDGTPGGHPVTVMNYAAWQARFGGAKDIVGKTLRLNNVLFTVIGVAPPRFIGVYAIFGPDFWIPAAMAEQLLPAEMQSALTDRSKAVFQGVGRLKPGISRAQAEADLATIGAALARAWPLANEGRTASVRPIADAIFGIDNSSTGRNPILFGSAVLMAVVGLVLLIACSNVANLLLARSAARRHEISVRLAMGASRGRLVRQLLTESVFLGLLSGLLGIAIGVAGVQLLWSFLPAEVSANLVTPKLDAPVFVFAMLLALLTGFVFGTAPALRASRTGVAETLKEEARTTGRSRRRITFANALLVGQVAFSFVTLVTAALFLRSIERAYRIDPGFETQHLAVLMTNPGQAGYGKPQTMAFYQQVRERVAALPGVESASWASLLPLWGWMQSGLEVEGRDLRSKAESIATVVDTVDAGYFRTAGIALDRGRYFTEMDQDGGTWVAIVNQKLAHDYWPGQEVLGKHIRLPGEKVRRQVIGVVKTANYTTLGEPPQLCVYVPLKQSYSDAMVLYVRSKWDPNQILLPVQREVRAVGPRISVDDVRTGRKIVDQSLFGAKIGVALLSAFGLLALGLASIGLYGIMAYSVNRRRREIGLRMALGAAQESVLRLILKQGMSLVLAGVAAGLVAALAVGQLLSRMLYGVSASDPVSVAAAAAVLLAVALVACYLPARSASRLDPLTALREE